MAQIGNVIGFVDKRDVQGQAADSIATKANYITHSAINARLTAINGTLYSTSNLSKLNYNDKVYALRLNDDAGGI